MAAISKVRMLLDGVYGQRFLNQIGSPAALVSSRKLSVHGSWAEYDKKKKKEEEEEKKKEEAGKAMRRSVLQMSIDVLDLASDAKSDKRKTSDGTGEKAPDASSSKPDRDS